MNYTNFAELSGWCLYSHSDYSLGSLFDNNYEGVLRKFLKKDVFEGFDAYFIDYHMSADLSPEHIHPKTLLPLMKNKSIMVINWGYYSGKYQTMSPKTNSYCYKNKICNDDIFIVEYKLENEYLARIEKIDNDLICLYADEENNKYIFYFLYDSIHLDNMFEKKLIEQLIFSVMKQSKLDIFDLSYLKTEQSKNNEIIVPKEFKSIHQVCESLNLNKEEIIEEMISKVDISRITNIVNSHLSFEYDAGYISKKITTNKEKIKKWLRRWAENKYEYYIMFNRQFTIQTEVEYEKSSSDTAMQVKELCYRYPQYAPILYHIETECYRKNVASGMPSMITEFFPCQEGMKLSKYLSKLIKDEKFDIEISKITQDKYMKRNAYISIDPYDYLTSSINRSGWKSCHHFVKGEHSVGSASYMFDETTLVAYLCSDKEYEYEFYNYKFKGNSKNWRQLIYVDTVDNRCIFSRQYPQDYCGDTVAKQIRYLIEEKISDFCDIDNIWTISKNQEEQSVHYDFPYTIAYNDIPHQQTYMIVHKFHKDITHRPSIGEIVNCPICNKPNEKKSSRLVCCPECGEYHSPSMPY